MPYTVAHAESRTEGTLAAFLVIRVEVTDPVRWTAYREAVTPLIAAFGGRHVTGAGGATSLEGSEAARVALFEFPSTESIKAFWDSPQYAPVRELRRDAAELEAWAVPGL